MDDVKIKVENSGIVKLNFFDDFPDGNLTIAEGGENIPFDIKRVYFINNLFNKKSVRGKHAHKELEQIILCINGHFTLNLDDGNIKQSVFLDDSHVGIKLGRMLWHEMKGFSNDCVILVFASEHYDENDYIRNYQDFLNLTK